MGSSITMERVEAERNSGYRLTLKYDGGGVKITRISSLQIIVVAIEKQVLST